MRKEDTIYHDSDVQKAAKEVGVGITGKSSNTKGREELWIPRTKYQSHFNLGGDSQ